MPRYTDLDPVLASELTARDDDAQEKRLSDLEQQERDKDCDKETAKEK